MTTRCATDPIREVRPRTWCMTRSASCAPLFDNPAFLESGSTDVSTNGVVLAEVP
jgi:hypothetical protein